MSVLEVSHLSHSYGGREIFEDVSFRLLKGEHVAGSVKILSQIHFIRQ